MEKDKNILEEHIMQRIYLMWFGRYLRESRLVRLVALLLFVAVLRFWVSFGAIFQNMRNMELNSSALPKYFSTAFVATEPAVQVIAILLAFLGLLFLVDFGKLATRGFRPKVTI